MLREKPTRARTPASTGPLFALHSRPLRRPHTVMKHGDARTCRTKCNAKQDRAHGVNVPRPHGQTDTRAFWHNRISPAYVSLESCAESLRKPL